MNERGEMEHKLREFVEGPRPRPRELARLSGEFLQANKEWPVNMITRLFVMKALEKLWEDVQQEVKDEKGRCA